MIWTANFLKWFETRLIKVVSTQMAQIVAIWEFRGHLNVQTKFTPRSLTTTQERKELKKPQLPLQKIWDKSLRTTPTQSLRALFPVDLWSRAVSKPSPGATTWTCRCHRIRLIFKSRTKTLLLNKCKRDGSLTKLVKGSWTKRQNFPTNKKWSLPTPCTIRLCLGIERTSTKVVNCNLDFDAN